MVFGFDSKVNHVEGNKNANFSLLKEISETQV